MKKLIAILSVILVSSLLACQTTPDKTSLPGITPPPDAEALLPEVAIGLSIEDWEINFDVVEKKSVEETKCYKVLKITRLPNYERNIWYKAGLRVGDYIVMVESKPGHMGTLTCDTLENTIEKWFPGKAGGNLCSNWARVRIDGADCIKDPNGFYVERLRFEDHGGFSLETLRVIYE